LTSETPETPPLRFRIFPTPHPSLFSHTPPVHMINEYYYIPGVVRINIRSRIHATKHMKDVESLRSHLRSQSAIIFDNLLKDNDLPVEETLVEKGRKEKILYYKIKCWGTKQMYLHMSRELPTYAPWVISYSGTKFCFSEHRSWAKKQRTKHMLAHCKP
jgi:hypothetical protein